MLSNERRLRAIRCMDEADGALTVREISEQIAKEETGESPPPTDARKSVYVSLQQSHLPKLEELDIVEYDDNEKKVKLGDGAKDLYEDDERESYLDWNAFYIGVSIIAVLTYVAYLRTGLVNRTLGVFLTLTYFVLIFVATAYRYMYEDLEIDLGRLNNYIE
ncbi:MAG: ArsR family transcriptional regulator [Halobacteria archaeon]|nr:ArsR family transcriptional regulator [Halobacteria archaeon]